MYWLTILMHKPDGTAEVNAEHRSTKKAEVQDWLRKHQNSFLDGGLKLGERHTGKVVLNVPPHLRRQLGPSEDVEQVSFLHNLPI
jgi:hypothetical protein